MPQPTLPPADPAAPPMLTAEHLAQRAAAKAMFVPVKRWIGVVQLSAWCLALFGVCSAPFAPFSLKGAFVTLALGACAYFEFRGLAALRRLDTACTRILTTNQAALGVVIAAYCLWSAYDAWFGPIPFESLIASSAGSSPEVQEMLEPIYELARKISTIAYLVAIPAGVGWQVAIVLYYRGRGRKLEAYLRETPAWVLQLDRPEHTA